MQHVAVLHDIFLAFGAGFAGGFRALFAVQCDVIGIGDGFGADIAFFKIGVDDAGGFGPACADCDCPGAGFFRPDGEIGDEVQQAVACADQAVEAGFFKAQCFEIFAAVFVR